MSGNLSLIYDLTPKSVAGVSLRVGGADGKSNSTTESVKYIKGIRENLSTAINEIKTPFKQPELSVVAYYNLKTDDKGSNIDISANYSRSLNTSLGNMEYANDEDMHILKPLVKIEYEVQKTAHLQTT